MRWKVVLLALLVLGVSSIANAQAAAEPMTLQAKDGVKVSALLYKAEHPKAVILLFHQAGSSKSEYATIAPRLAKAGYTALAIDQRSGGNLYGPNETVEHLGKSADYEQAIPDLEAALAWGQTQHLPVVLWGSSYSSSLVFIVAAARADQVAAVMSFSPGEYFSDKHAIGAAASHLTMPIYVTSSSDQEEVQAAKAILAASPSAHKTQYVPPHGIHGASTLIATRNPEGAEENWTQALAFLGSITAKRG